MVRSGTRVLRTVMRGQTALGSVLSLAAFGAGSAYAGPVGTTVISGDVSITTSGTSTVYNQTTNTAILNHDSFNIEQNESVHFEQPTTNSLAVNRVIGNDLPTTISGKLTATGNVWVINPSGIAVSKGAEVNVNGLIATTANISDQNILSGNRTFTGAPEGSTITNAGTISGGDGSIVIVAPVVKNTGTITASGSDVAMGAGSGFAVDFDGDGLTRFEVTPGKNVEIATSGEIKAEGGAVYISAESADAVKEAVVSVGGKVEATRAEERGGVIYISSGNGETEVSGTVDASQSSGKGGKIIVTGDAVTLTETAALDVSGPSGGGTVHVGGAYQGAAVESPVLKSAAAPDSAPLPTSKLTYVARGATIKANATESGDGGEAVVWSDGDTLFYGTLEARGGFLAGDGGLAEISGKLRLGFDGTVDLSAPNGSVGTILFDPRDITIAAGNNSADDAEVGDGEVASGDGQNSQDDFVISAGPLETASAAGDVTLAATRDISVDAAITLTNDLTLTADGDVTIGAAIDDGAATASLVVNAGDSLDVNAAIDLGGSVELNANTDNNGNETLAFGAGGSISASGINLDSPRAVALGNLTLAGGELSVTTTGDAITQIAGTTIIATAGTSTFDTGSGDITLLNLTNDFASNGATANVQFDGGAVSIYDANAIAVSDTIADSLTVTAATSASIGGNISVGGTISVTANTTVTLGSASTTSSIATTGGGNISIAADDDALIPVDAIRFYGNTSVDADGTLTLTAGSDGFVDLGAGTVELTTSGAFSLPTTTFDQADLVLNTTGAVGQTGVLDIDGKLTVNTTDDDITLTNVLNDFGTFSGFGDNIAVKDANGLGIGGIDAGGDLTINALNGAITDDGVSVAVTDDVVVAGTTILTATGAISLDGSMNDFTGPVNASGTDITLIDSSAIQLADIDASTLSVTALAGGITDTGTGAAVNDDVNVSGAATLSATGDITIDDTYTDFGGSLTIDADTNADQDVTIVDVNTISLAGLDATGNVNLTAGGSGDIELPSGTADIGGDLSLTAAGGRIHFSNVATTTVDGLVTISADRVFDFVTSGDVTFGEVTATNATYESWLSAVGSMELTDDVSAANLRLRATGDVLQSGGTITTNYLTLANNSSGNDWSLDQANSINTVRGTGPRMDSLTLRDSNGLILDGLSTGDLTITLTSIGALTDTGKLDASGDTVIDAGSNAVTLDFTTNDFADVGSGSNVDVTGTNVTLVDDDNIALGSIDANGTLTVTAGGAIGDTEGEKIDVTGATSLTALDGGTRFDILLDNTTTRHDFNSDETFANSNIPGGGADQVTFTGADVVINDADRIVLGTSTATGDVTITANDVEFDGLVTAPGTLTLANWDNSDIGLGSAAGATSTGNLAYQLTNTDIENISTTTLRIESTGDVVSAGLDTRGTDFVVDNLSILDIDADNVTFASLGGLDIVLGNLIVDADGSITQGTTAAGTNGRLYVSGTSDLTASSTIALAGSTNWFGGAVSAAAVDVTLVKAGSLVLDDFDVTGDLSLTALGGSITDVGTTAGTGRSPGDDINVDGSTSLSATGAITLDARYNDFGDTAPATLSMSGTDLAIIDVDAINLGSITGATLTLTAGGNVTQSSGSISITGDTDISSTGGSVLLDTTSNDFVTLSGTAQSYEVVEVLGVSIEDLTATTGDITVTSTGGAIVVTAGSTVNAAGDISLTSADQSVTTGVGSSLSATNVTISATGAPSGYIDLDGSVASTETLTGTAGTSIYVSSLTAQDLALTTTSGSIVQQAGTISVSDTSTLSAGGGGAIDLDFAANDFGTVLASTLGQVSLYDVDEVTLGNVSAGSLTLTTANGSIAQVTGSSIIVTGATILTAGGTNADIELDEDANDFDTVLATATGDAVSLTDANDLVINGLTAGTFNLAAGGAVTDAGTITVTGDTTVTTTGDLVSFDIATNDFDGGVNVDTTAGSSSPAAVTLYDDTAIKLGAISASSLLVVAGGSITDTSNKAITVTGFATLIAAGDGTAYDIQIDNSDLHDFSTTSALTLYGEDIVVDDVDGILLGDVTALADGAADPTISGSAGDLTIRAGGDVTQAAGTVIDADGLTTLSSTGAFTLTNSNNDFVTAAVEASSFSITDISGIVFGDVTADNASVTAGGAISQITNSTWDVSGTSTFVAPTTSNVTLSEDGNDFGTINAQGLAISINDVDGIVLADIDAFGALTVSANGTIEDNGATDLGDGINVAGNTTLTATGGQDITLDNTVNDFGSDLFFGDAFTSVSASGGAITLTDVDAIKLASITATSFILSAGGSVTDTAGQGITVSGDTAIVAEAAGDTYDIRLDGDDNLATDLPHDFDTITVTGEDVALVDANDLTVSGSASLDANDDATLGTGGTLAIVTGGDLTIDEFTAGGTATLESAAALSLVALTADGDITATSTDRMRIGTVTSTSGAIYLTTNDNFSVIDGNPYPLTAYGDLLLYAPNGSFVLDGEASPPNGEQTTANALPEGLTFTSETGLIEFDFAVGFTVTDIPGNPDTVVLTLDAPASVIRIDNGFFGIGTADFLVEAQSTNFNPFQPTSAPGDPDLLLVTGDFGLISDDSVTVRLQNTSSNVGAQDGTGTVVEGNSFLGGTFDGITLFGEFGGFVGGNAALSGFSREAKAFGASYGRDYPNLNVSDSNTANGCIIGTPNSCTPLGSATPVLNFEDGRLLGIKFVDPTEDEDDPFSNRGDEEEWE